MFTKAWSAALLNAFGDILAQKVVDKNDRLDLKRLGIFTFLVGAPAPASLNAALLRQMASRFISEALCIVLLTGEGTWLPDPQAGTTCRVWSS